LPAGWQRIARPPFRRNFDRKTFFVKSELFSKVDFVLLHYLPKLESLLLFHRLASWYPLIPIFECYGQV
jgi:hypothetical protein